MFDIRHHTRLQFQSRPHPRQQGSIDAVGPGKSAGGAGELAGMARIDPGEGYPGFAQGINQRRLLAAGGFENHLAAGAVRGEGGERLGLGRQVIVTPGSGVENVDPVLGDIDADEGL